MQVSVKESDSSVQAAGALILAGLAVGSRVAAPERRAASARGPVAVQDP